MLTQVENAFLHTLKKFGKWVLEQEKAEDLKKLIIGGQRLPKGENKNFLQQLNSVLTLQEYFTLYEHTEHPKLGYVISTQDFLKDINTLFNKNPKPNLRLWAKIWHEVIQRLMTYKENKALRECDLFLNFGLIKSDKVLKEWFDKVVEIQQELNYLQLTKPWHFSGQTKTLILYEKVKQQPLFKDPELDDMNLVNEFFQGKLSGYQYAEIKMIVNKQLIDAFTATLERCEKFYGNKKMASIEKELDASIIYEAIPLKTQITQANIDWRNTIREQCLTFMQAHEKYKDEDYPHVHILKLVSGYQSKAAVMGIANTGFIHILGARDDGYFGKGYYFTDDVNYAAVYARNKNLPDQELNFVISNVMTAVPLPVINGDKRYLNGAGNPNGFDSTYIPVVHIKNDVYLPPNVGKKAEHTEIAVFEYGQCLPVAYVTLKPC